MKLVLLFAPVAIILVSCRHSEPEAPPPLEPSEAERLRLAEQQDRRDWQQVQRSFGKDFFAGAQTATRYGWTIYSRDLKLTADSVESRGPMLALKKDMVIYTSRANGFCRVSQLRSDEASVELKRFQIFRARGESPHPWSHLLPQ